MSKIEQSSMSSVMSLASDSLKLWADWLELQQAYVRFLEDCMAFWGRVHN